MEGASKAGVPAEWDIREGSVRGWPRVFKGKRRGGYR